MLVSPTGVPDGYYMLVAAKQRKVILKEEKMLIFKQQRDDPDNLEAAFLTFEVPSCSAIDLPN